MKCPKCSYTSFEYLDSCKKCGADLRDVRTLLQVISVSPDERAPRAASSAPASDEPSAYGYADAAATATDLSALSAPAPTGEGDDALLGDLNFDQSFADMVEPTSYDDSASGSGTPAGTDEEGLLDLDFGDVFADKDKAAH